jgi:ABC-type bacteriocin/lantibiotic exporter with double-glycine peptidase domain
VFEPTAGFAPAREAERRGPHGARHGARRYLAAILAEWPSLGKILVTSMMIQLLALALPVTTGVLVDRVVPTASHDLLAVLTAGLAVVVGFHFLSSLIRLRMILQLNLQLDQRMTTGFLEHLVDLPYPFFQQRSAGDLMTRLNSNARIREILTGGGISALLDALLMVFYLALLLLGSLPIGLLVLGLGLLRVGLFLVARRRHQDLMSAALEAEARSRSYQVQLLAGMETLKASGAERVAVNHWSGLFVRELNVALARGRLGTIIQSALHALGLASPLIVLLLSTRQVLAGTLTLGEMFALGALAVGFLAPLTTLVPIAFEFQLLGSYLARINDVLETPGERLRPGRLRPAQLSGRISLAAVSFSYGPRAPLVIRDLSVEIQPQQLVAVVGPSGAGKSTLAGLLVGLYEPVSGRILHDGLELARLDLRWLRRQMGIVPQQPYLFGTTIRDNIALSDPTLPLERIVAAARLAHLHDEIETMPLGYDTPLADGGVTLSGGQRQRLALARALVHRPSILLLDEATSSLDAELEHAIGRELRALGCTRVVIAHRLSTVADADLILVLVAGRLVERGTHAELLRRGGWYARMVESQDPERVPGPLPGAWTS